MKKAKKLLAVLLVGVMVFALAGCSSSDDSSSDSADSAGTDDAATETLTIGYSYPTANNEFWVNALTYVEECADTLGFEIMSEDCNNDQAEQITDVESMISSGIDALVLGPQDASVVAGIAASCETAGIPLVIIDRSPEDDVTVGEDYVCFIGPNDEDAGYQQAIALIEAGCTQIVALGGYQSTSVAENRKAGLDKALEEHPEVTLLQYEYAGESMDEGDEVFRNLYQANPDLDGVWCYNDSLALAAVNVLKEEGLVDSVKVGGMDCLSPAIESMQAGELYYSIGGHYLQAAFGCIVAFDVASGYEYTGEDAISLSLFAVSQENLDEYGDMLVNNELDVDWESLSQTTNPDADYDFVLSLE